MGTALTSATIGKNTSFASDKFFSATALASTGATTSGEFLFAQTLGGAEIRLVANTAIVTGGGETLVVTIVTADASGGTFNNTLFTYTVEASTTIAAGATICAYVAPQAVSEVYTKVIVTSDFDASAQKVDGLIIEV